MNMIILGVAYNPSDFLLYTYNLLKYSCTHLGRCESIVYEDGVS